MRKRLFFQDTKSLRVLLPALRENSRALLTQPLYVEAYADSADTQHGNYHQPANQLADFASVLGIRFLLEGDEACAEKLKAAMLHYAAYGKWIGRENLRKRPPWHSELNTGRFLFGMSLGLDCLYDRFTPEERNYLAQRCTCLGIAPTLDDWLSPEHRIHALDSMGHNWWPVCVSAAGLATVAFREELPEAEHVCQRVDEGLAAFFAYDGLPLQNKGPNFDPSGAMYEGAVYLAYALGELLTYRLARQNVYGTKCFAYDALLPRCFRFLCHAVYDAGDDVLNVPIGDCNPHESLLRAFRLGAVCGFDAPELRWYMGRKQGQRDLWWALAGEAPGCPPAETLGYYPGVGMAFLRDSWKEKSRLLCVKCGNTWNHAHADAGSFVLYDNGQAIFEDSGSCSYARKEYPLYYCQSEAHNVMLFNGHGQEAEDHYFGLRHPGKLLACEDGWLRYVLADASGPMCRYLKRHFRSFFMLPEAIVLIDDATSYEPGTLSLLFHHEGSTDLQGATAFVRHAAAPYTLEALYPACARLEKRLGLRDHRPDVPQAYLSLEVPIVEASLHPLPQGDPNSLIANRPVCTQKVITVLQSKALPTSCVETPETLTVTIGDTSIALNLLSDTRNMHINSHATLLGWQTDAYILAVRGRDYFVCGGSYLRKAGNVVFSALRKQNVFGAFGQVEAHGL